ncbi:MAG: hypothetical protein GY811_29590 [Myxococcales bacterium]|nr:hypothetical protein [Myxococcales bacterium]
MNSLQVRLVLIAAFSFLCCALAAKKTDACDREAANGISTPPVLPATGQTAPLNTNIWVSEPIYYTYGPNAGPLEAEEIVLRSNGVVLAVRARTVSVVADYLTHLWVIDPVDLLEDGQVVEVWVRNELGSTFTAQGGELTAAPAAPVLEALDVNGEYFGYLFCGARPTVAVRVESETALLFLTEIGPVTEMPRSAMAVGSGRTATALEMEPGDLELQVIAIDLAGNRSEPTPLPEVTVPPPITGCSVAGNSSARALWPLVLALLLVGLWGRQGASLSRREN